MHRKLTCTTKIRYFINIFLLYLLDAYENSIIAFDS